MTSGLFVTNKCFFVYQRAMMHVKIAELRPDGSDLEIRLSLFLSLFFCLVKTTLFATAPLVHPLTSSYRNGYQIGTTLKKTDINEQVGG